MLVLVLSVINITHHSVKRLLFDAYRWIGTVGDGGDKNDFIKHSTDLFLLQ